ncbi:MAG: phosphotransferase family protein, partial [Gammaproteobacteria bacterium]
MTPFADRVRALCCRLSGTDAPVSELRRLSGGASMESWYMRHNGQSWILRRLPEGMTAENSSSRRINPALEMAVVQAAHRAGVQAPEVIGGLLEADQLGEGFVMSFLPGETLPQKILGKPAFEKALGVLTQQCAQQLGAIHAIDPADLPQGLVQQTALDKVDGLAQSYQNSGAQLPLFEQAIHWLRNHLPPSSPPVLLHGDFRMGNLMVDHEGLAGVLDWELAHLGDRVSDIAYLCTPSWRFGHYHNTVGGFGQLQSLLDAYQACTGYSVSDEQVQFWLVFSTLLWGVICLGMIESWRQGQDSSLERAVIGCRTSETEIDLLLLLEEIMDWPAAQVDWQLPQDMALRGSTDATELLTALSTWVQQSVVPLSKNYDLFQARVAGNALSIVRRQMLWGPVFEQRKQQRRQQLALGSGAEHAHLCAAIQRGQLDWQTPALVDHLRLDLLERLAIEQPKYAGFAAAVAKWT